MLGGYDMKCPVCENVTLLMTERNGVEIDYCPQCRGVWLDRGELDKIVERAREEANDYRRHDQMKHYDHKPQKKKKSMFSDILEMFGEE